MKSSESMAIEVLRKMMMAVQTDRVVKVTVTVEEEVATYLNNRKRRELTILEDQNNVEVVILGREGLSPEHLKIECEGADGRELRFNG